MLYAIIMLSGLVVFGLGAVGLYSDYKFKVTSMDRREEIFFLKESLTAERQRTDAEREQKEAAQKMEVWALGDLDKCSQQISVLRSEVERRSIELTPPTKFTF